MATKKNTARQERAQRQAEYTALQRCYDDLYDNAPVGYYTLDPAGTILEVNETAARQLGMSKSALIHTTFQTYLIQADTARFQTYLQEAFTRPRHRLDDVRLKKTPEAHFYARIESALLPEDALFPAHNQIAARLTVCDLTELHEAHNMLLRREGELGLFNRVSQVLSSARDLDQILVLLMEEVRRLLEVTACSIWLIDSGTGELICRQAIGPHRDTILGWRLSPGQGIAGWVASSGQSLLVNNTTADERHFDGVDRLTGEPLHSILCVPMYAQQEVIGVLQVLDAETNRFTEMDRTLQELLATMTSIAIENARLHEQVHQDAKTKRLLLTDLNRRIAVMLSGTTRLLSTVRRYAALRKQTGTQTLMTTLLARMQGQKRVYAFLAEFEWNPLPLSELIHRVIQGTIDALKSDTRISVDIASSPARVTPEQADSIGLIINELVLNTVKHATIGRKVANITVDVGRIGDSLYIQYKDDGPGWPTEVTHFEQHQSGVYLLQKYVRKDLDGRLDLYNDDGAVAEIRCKSLVQSVI